MFRLFFVSVLGFAICIVIGCAWFTGFLLFRESLKGEDFCGFLGSVQIKIHFFCLLSSLSSQLGNSAELTDFSRFIPSCTDSMHTAVSDIVFNSVRTEAVITRPSRIGLGRFFEPCDWEKMAKSNACDARVIHVIQPLCELVKYLNQCHYIKEIIRGQSKG